MKKILNYILGTIFLFTACEYDPSGNNFIELTPPDDFIAIEISLNNINPSDTIYVYQDTQFSLKLNAGNRNLRQFTILFGTQEHSYYSWENPLNFVISPSENREGVYKLTVNAIFASGSGSLADLMGMEGYTGEMSWNIRIIHNL